MVALALVHAAAALAEGKVDADAPLPAATFYARPDIEEAVLSPSGRWLAMSKPVLNGRLGLVIYDVKEWKPLGAAAVYGDADIRDFHWVNDERLVYSLSDRTRAGGDQLHGSGLVSVRRDGSDQRQLVRFNWRPPIDARRLGREPLSPLHLLLRTLPGDGSDVIVGEWRYNESNEFEAIVPKRLNTATGESSPIAPGAPKGVNRWLFDAQGSPRIAITSAQGRGAIHERSENGNPWRVLAEYAFDEAPFVPLFLDHDGGLLVTVGEGAGGTDVLKRFDRASGKPQQEAFVSTPGFDFTGQLVRESAASPMLGMRVLTDAETTAWFDKGMAALQADADQRFPGHVNRLTCRRCGEPDMTVLVNSYSDRDPGQIWIYQAEGERWRKVGNRRDAIDPQRMATMQFHRIRTRDGQDMPVWLTLPAASKGKALPAVLLVHGGPWARGARWGWREDAQFLASRGYVVIEPEFRSSIGYGDAWYRAGFRQWGRAMQDDLIDALDWAVAQGRVDDRRVCIAGASYGGYATLMGLVRHPERFRCGVAWAAVTDPRQMFKWVYGSDQSDDVREHAYPKLIGDPVADAAMLDSVTPVLLADRIKAPLLLAFGGADARVPLIHGTRMRDALTAAGKPPEWVEYPGEGHGWYKIETQLDFARRLENFLAKNLR